MKTICIALVTLSMLGEFIVVAHAGQLCWQIDTADDDYDAYLTVRASGGANGQDRSTGHCKLFLTSELSFTILRAWSNITREYLHSINKPSVCRAIRRL